MDSVQCMEIIRTWERRSREDILAECKEGNGMTRNVWRMYTRERRHIAGGRRLVKKIRELEEGVRRAVDEETSSVT